MRTFEVALWLLIAGWSLWWLVRPPKSKARAGLVAAAIVLLGVHVGHEGARLQLVPIYLTMGALTGLTAWRWQEPPARGSRTGWALPMLLVVVLLVAGALPALFPVFLYDTPGGKYAIGTASYELADRGRNRALVVQFWYPAAAGAQGRRAGISPRPEALADAYAAFTGLPRFAFDSLRLIKTHAIEDAPLSRARERFPIVLFSHGPGSGNRSQSIFQMEELASRGFVVAAIDHTGYASTTIFPDGHAVPVGPSFSWPVFVDARSTAMLETWVKDARFVVDELERLDTGDGRGLLTGRLDLSKIGYLGASFGGSVVVQALLDDPRLKAGLAQDGKPYFAEGTAASLHRPLMYMQSAAPYMNVSDAQLSQWGLNRARFKLAEQDHYLRQMRLFAGVDSPIYNVFIRRTNHVTFSDLYRIIRLPDAELMDVRRAHRIINDYTVAYFDRYLNGASPALVDGRSPAPYPEVTAIARNAAAGSVALAGPRAAPAGDGG